MNLNHVKVNAYHILWPWLKQIKFYVGRWFFWAAVIPDKSSAYLKSKNHELDVVKIQNSLKCETQSFSSVFLSGSWTQAIFALLGKFSYLKLLSIAMAVIYSKPQQSFFLTDSFSWFNFCWHCLTSSLFTGKKTVSSLVSYFAVIVLLI